MTPKQLEYVRHRVAGHRPTQAARMAGYTTSPKTQASRLEKNPGVRAAIAEEAPPAPPPARSTPYQSAEDYLAAVVRGDEIADPVRVTAARALIQYQQPRTRRPLPPARSPTQSAADADAATERELEEAWQRKVADIMRRNR